MIWLITARVIQGIGAGAVSVLLMKDIMVSECTNNQPRLSHQYEIWQRTKIKADVFLLKRYISLWPILHHYISAHFIKGKLSSKNVVARSMSFILTLPCCRVIQMCYTAGSICGPFIGVSFSITAYICRKSIGLTCLLSLGLLGRLRQLARHLFHKVYTRETSTWSWSRSLLIGAHV